MLLGIASVFRNMQDYYEDQPGVLLQTGKKNAKKSLEKLERSDSGQLWQHAIHHELSLIKRDLKENSEELNVDAGANVNSRQQRSKAA